MRLVPKGHRLVGAVVQSTLRKKKGGGSRLHAFLRDVVLTEEELASAGGGVLAKLKSAIESGKQSGRIHKPTAQAALDEARALNKKKLQLMSDLNAERARLATVGSAPSPSSPRRFIVAEQGPVAGALLDRPLGGRAEVAGNRAAWIDDLEKRLTKDLEELMRQQKREGVKNWQLLTQIRLARIKKQLDAMRRAEEVAQRMFELFQAAKPLDKLKETVASFHKANQSALVSLGERLDAMERSQKQFDDAQRALDKVKASRPKPSDAKVKAAESAYRAAKSQFAKDAAAYKRIADPLAGTLRSKFKGVWQAGVKSVFQALAQDGALSDIAVVMQGANQRGASLGGSALPGLVLSKSEKGWVSIKMRIYEVMPKVDVPAEEFSSFDWMTAQEFWERTGRYVDVGLDFDHALTGFDAAFKSWIRTGKVNALLPIVDPAGFALSTRLSNQGVFNTLRADPFATAVEVPLSKVKGLLKAAPSTSGHLDLGDGADSVRRLMVRTMTNEFRKASLEVDPLELEAFLLLLPEKTLRL
jgi:tetratricopeptide (TPR) repeat protein